MRFGDFLKATVLLSAGCATLLAALTVLGIARDSDAALAYFAVAWWLVATGIGGWAGRHAAASPQIARLLAGARTQTTLPELRPGTTMLNRLWPLLFSTIGAGALAFVLPQVPAIATGFAIIWSLAWRRQASAVTAIEERDGAYFYVCRTSPVRPIVLERTPGFKALRPERVNGAVG